ncbi:hypothetical protein [Paenibacillus flagellatus]|nr:hypothetical protein [Paenibacillus flagellatus]
MTKTGYLRCEVCAKVTQVKIEVGYLDAFPLYVNCGHCGTLFSGRYAKNDEEVTASAVFRNATEIDASEADTVDYFCDASGELIMRKVAPAQRAADLMVPPVWMAFHRRLGPNGMKALFGRMVELHRTVNGPAAHEWSRVLDLWFNGKHAYLSAQLADVLDGTPLAGPVSAGRYVQAIRKLTRTLFAPLYGSERNGEFVRRVSASLRTLKITREAGLKAYLRRLHEMGLFDSCEKIAYGQLRNGLGRFEQLIPAFTLSELTDAERAALFAPDSAYGMTTLSFEDIKFLYVDLFESVVKVLPVIVGLNNLLHRGSHHAFLNGGATGKKTSVSSLEQYVDLYTAADKMKLIDYGEAFSVAMHGELNNKLRNAIGHYAYRYDSLEQKIVYDNGRKVMSLLQFGYGCYELILTLLDLFDLTMFLHEVHDHYFPDENVSNNVI